MPPSTVWLYMSRVKENPTKVKCAKCGNLLTHRVGSSTSTLRNHLVKQHQLDVPTQQSTSRDSGKSRKRSRLNSEDLDSDEDGNLEVNEAPTSSSGAVSPAPSLVRPLRPVSAPPAPSSSQNSGPNSRTAGAGSFTGPLDKCFNNTTAFKRGGARDAECTDAFLYMLAKDNMPLCTTEREGFKVFVNTLQPQWRVPGEPYVTKLLNLKAQQLKELVASEIEKSTCLNLTLDIWTQKGTMRSFLGITAHYPKDWVMVSIEIGAERLFERKTIPYLRKVIQKICLEWKIKKENVRAVITDGGSNIKGAVKEEFPHKHLSCIGHLLDNIGQRIMKTGLMYAVPSEVELRAPEPDDPIPEHESDVEDEDENENEWQDVIDNTLLCELIKKVKTTVKFFRQSEVATSELAKLQMEEFQVPETKCLKLKQEVRTRWNSCYAMIDRYLQLADLINRVLLKVQRDKNCKGKPPTIMDASEIEALTEIRDLLKPLDTATHEVSKEKFPTLSKCIPLVKALKSSVAKFQPATPIGLNLKAELEKRLHFTFVNTEEIKMYGLATILDPRFKKVGFANVARASASASVAADLVKRKMQQTQGAAGAAAEANANVAEDDPKDDFWGDIDDDVKNAGSNYAASAINTTGYVDEFRAYLNSPPIDRKTNPNPLLAWESLKTLYPNVHQVAMQHLPILSSSVPCERLFSHAGLIGTQLRNRLSGKHLSMFVFLRSVSKELWFKAGLPKV